MDLKPVIEVKRQNLAYLFSRRNVVACGVGFKETEGGITDEPCVVVSVAKKMPEAQLSPADIVPKKLGEVKTDVQETGVIRALQGHTDRWRPAPGGAEPGRVQRHPGPAADDDHGDRRHDQAGPEPLPPLLPLAQSAISSPSAATGDAVAGASPAAS